jgi:nitroreductase
MDEGPAELSATVAAVDAVIRARRTSLLMDPTDEVPRELVDHLIELATWAPNHKRTWPWRFTVLVGDARHRFGEALAAVAATDPTRPPDKVAKLATKYARANVVVLVWVRLDGSELRRREDRDAVAAAVQTLLLAATSFGLGNYWASLDEQLADAAQRFAGLDPDHDLVGLVYLGWPTGTVAAPARPPAQVRWID